MNKEEIAYKMTSEIFKHYKIETLEEKYNKFGGKLISEIYSEIYNNLSSTDISSDETNHSKVVIISGEEKLK